MFSLNLLSMSSSKRDYKKQSKSWEVRSSWKNRSPTMGHMPSIPRTLPRNSFKERRTSIEIQPDEHFGRVRSASGKTFRKAAKTGGHQETGKISTSGPVLDVWHW